jgi:hypothetical protein
MWKSMTPAALDRRTGAQGKAHLGAGVLDRLPEQLLAVLQAGLKDDVSQLVFGGRALLVAQLAAEAGAGEDGDALAQRHR